MNKTEMLLLIRFESPTIPLDSICREYFGYSIGTAKQKAKAGTLPVPAFRLGASQKMPWMVNITDLSAYIDKHYEDAKCDWVGH